MKPTGRRVTLLALAFAAASFVPGCSRTHGAEGDLRSNDPIRRAAAADAIGAAGDPDAVPALLAALGDSVPGVRERIVEALARLADRRQAPVLVERILADPDAGVRRAAASALGVISADSGALILLPSLDGPTPTVRFRAAGGLAALLRTGGDRIGPRNRERLGGALGDVARSARERRYGMGGIWIAWENWLTGTIAVEDTLEIVADETTVALAWLGGNEAGAPLRTALRLRIAPSLRDSVAAILVARNDSAVVAGFADELRTTMVSPRRRTIELMGAIGHPVVEALLLDVVADSEQEIRRAGWEALLRVHGVVTPEGNPPARYPLRKWDARVVQAANRAMDDPVAEVAALAAIASARAGGPSVARKFAGSGVAIRENESLAATGDAARLGIASADDALRYLADDAAPENRIIAVRALGIMGGRAARRALEKTAVVDHSPAVREAARRFVAAGR